MKLSTRSRYGVRLLFELAFNYNKGLEISGDIYISIDRVSENALTYKVSFMNELIRVIVHGVLHLLGYHDTSNDEKKEMKSMEDLYLGLYKDKLI